MQIVTCGLDTAKSIFHFHGLTAEGEVKRKTLRRKQVLPFFAQLEPCTIGMEACGGSHYWARELGQLGHSVFLISPQFVVPYVKGNKNDYNDAEGICEALSRPTMRFVGVKTQAQQDILMLHRIRENRVKQRTALVNQIRGLLGEYGLTFTTGVTSLQKGLCELLGQEDDRLSALAREQFHALYEELLHQVDRVDQSDRSLKAVFKQCEASQRLASLPGVGFITATVMVAYIGDVSQFKNGRELSAYLGLVPRQHSSGGKAVLLGISKRGNTYLRTLLIHGARSVLRYVEGKKDSHSLWLSEIAQRRGQNKACVAQANKTARRVWALLSQETSYQLAA